MEQLRQMIVFLLDEQRFALSLDVVERVVPAAEIRTLPKVPDVVLGVIDVEGEIIPVADVRKRFRLPAREIALSDHLILAHTRTRSFALLVDAVWGVVDLPPGQTTAADAIFPGLDYVKGVTRLGDDLVLIHDLETFLSPTEAVALDAALAVELPQS